MKNMKTVFLSKPLYEAPEAELLVVRIEKNILSAKEVDSCVEGI